jgi:hypothetical protein
MYTGTLIRDLIALVERVERSSRLACITAPTASPAATDGLDGYGVLLRARKPEEIHNPNSSRSRLDV